uniref:Terminase_6 domain-containing protein n=1 Tax=Caenorhabditis tropicalis TaxID=1561998 RepID=A0A1I7TF44_9PELO
MSHGNFLAGESLCRAHNSTLTGFQTNAERLKIGNVAKQTIQSLQMEEALMWIGARRHGHCPRFGMCFPKETFFWTDNFTKGKEAFQFYIRQPDAYFNPKWGFEACVQQMIFASGTTYAKYPRALHAQLNDLHCQNPKVQMCACGRRP